jgi:hypothetical protein
MTQEQEKQQTQEAIKRLKQMKPVNLLVIVLASVLLSVGYFVFVGLASVWIVVVTNGIGYGASSLIGAGLFLVLVVAELSLVVVFGKPSLFLLLFAIPAVIGIIAIKGAYSSEMAKDVIKKVETAVRTPPLVRKF